MDVRLPDGTLLKNVPEGTTKEQLILKLINNGYDVSGLVGQITPPQPTEVPVEPSRKQIPRIEPPPLLEDGAFAAGAASAAEAGLATPPALYGARLGMNIPGVHPLLGAVGGGIGGAVLGTAGIKEAQEGIDKLFGTDIAKTRQEQIQEHPTATAVGSLVGGGINPWMRPGLMGVKESLIGAGLQTGIGGAQRMYEEQSFFDPVQTPLETLIGAFTKPTALGEKLLGLGTTPKVKPTEDVSVPPDATLAKVETTTNLSVIKERLLNHRVTLEKELSEAKVKAENNPNQQFLVTQAEQKLLKLDEAVNEVDGRLTKLGTDAEVPATAPKETLSELSKLETEYVEARRRANEIAAKQDEATKAGRANEVAMLDEQFELAIEKRNQAKADLDKARRVDSLVKQGYNPEDSSLLSINRAGSLRSNNDAFNALVNRDGLTNVSNKALEESIAYRETLKEKYNTGQAKELLDSEIATLKAELERRPPVQKTEGEATTVPPTPKETLGEAPRGLPEAPLVDKTGKPMLTGEDTSVQVEGVGVKSGDIAEAFDLAKVRTWSDEAIANAIAIKEAKLQDPGTASSVKDNIRKELDTLYGEQSNRAFDFSQEVPEHPTPPTTIAGLKDAVEAGGWRNGLVHIINNLPSDDILSIISKTLLKNKWLNPDVIYKDLPEGKFGRYEHGTENIFMSRMSPDNATVLVHESIHRGSSNAILQYEADPSLLTSKERRAINRLKEIYELLKSDPKLSSAEAEKTVMKNMRELLAYGIGHEGVASHLNGIYLPGEKVSIFRKLVNAAMDLLGFEPKVRSAYEELLGIGKTLISEAKPIQPPQVAKANLANQLSRANVPTVLTHTQDSLLGLVDTGRITDIGSKLSSIYHTMFGKGQLKEIWDNPVIRYVGTIVQRAENEAVTFKNIVLNGYNQNVAGPVGKRHISTKQYIANNSVRKTFKDLTNKMAYDLHQWNKKFFDEMVTVESIKAEMKAAGVEGNWFEYHLGNRVKQLQDAGVNQKVIDAYVSEKKATYAGLVENNDMLSHQGRKPIPIRPDYFPAIRKGKFAVSVMVNDVLYHNQLFRTELEAKLFQKKMEGYEGYTTKLEDLDLSREGIPSLDEMMDFTLNMFKRLNIDPEAIGFFNAMDQMTTTGMRFGKHQEFREGISGYAGSEWFRTADELGEKYKHAIFDWADEQAAIRTKQKIKFDTERVLGTGTSLENNLPNTLNVARYIRDIAMNQVPEWGWASAFDKTVRNVADGLVHNVAKMFGKEDYVPVISPVDRLMGVSSSMFYMTTLMARPGFWASQVLTSPLSLRYMLRDDTIPLSSIASSFSKGSSRTFGFVKYDKEAASVMEHLVNNTTSLRPQLQNELNTISWLDVNAHEKLGKVLRVITGQAPAEAADVLSRIWTANMMIEHYRGVGLKGRELIDAVANAVDNTMVSYTRSNKAAWVNKSGMVGQSANPLLTFGTAQLGNLVSDIHYMAQQGTLRSALPALSTMAVTMLMGGAMGLPILVEYQFLRDMIVGNDPDYDWMPNPKKWLLQQPAVIERGAVSAVTGFDVGSGMRWNPFFDKPMINDQKSLIDAFPAIAFMGNVGKAVGMSLLEATGAKKYTEAEKRKAYLAVTPFVGGKSLVEATTFGSLERKNVPGTGSKGIVPQTFKEHLSTLLGSRTLERARIQDKTYMASEREKSIQSKQSKYISLYADAVAFGSPHEDYAIEKLAELGLNAEEVRKLVMDRVEEYGTPEEIRWLQGGEGQAALRKKLRRIELFGTELNQ